MEIDPPPSQIGSSLKRIDAQGEALKRTFKGLSEKQKAATSSERVPVSALPAPKSAGLGDTWESKAMRSGHEASGSIFANPNPSNFNVAVDAATQALHRADEVLGNDDGYVQPNEALAVVNEQWRPTDKGDIAARWTLGSTDFASGE